MEQTFEVKPIGLKYLCDECGQEMSCEGSMVIENDQPFFPHKCNCGNVIKLTKKYPTIEYKRI